MPDAPSTKPVAEKLGPKEGQRWILLGADQSWLARDLRERGVRTSTRLPTHADGIVFRAATLSDLDALTRLRAVIAPAGAIGVFWAKGRPALNEDHVRAAALAQGLVDVKVIRVSDELSGLKLVIPVALRG